MNKCFTCHTTKDLHNHQLKYTNTFGEEVCQIVKMCTKCQVDIVYYSQDFDTVMNTEIDKIVKEKTHNV